MAVISVVFERQGEGSGDVNGLAHVCARPLADNHRVHATTWHRGHLDGLVADLDRDQTGIVVRLAYNRDRHEIAYVKVGTFLATPDDENACIHRGGCHLVGCLAGNRTLYRERELVDDLAGCHELIDEGEDRAGLLPDPQLGWSVLVIPRVPRHAVD